MVDEFTNAPGFQFLDFFLNQSDLTIVVSVLALIGSAMIAYAFWLVLKDEV